MTSRRAFWEAFATVCLPSLAVWTIVAYLMKSKIDLADGLPIYLFLAILPMPLAFPVYRRYLKGTSRCTNKLSPPWGITLAILFAFVAIMHAIQIPELLRGHKSFWDVVFHVAIATVWLIMSIEYFRSAIRQHGDFGQNPAPKGQ